MLISSAIKSHESPLSNSSFAHFASFCSVNMSALVTITLDELVLLQADARGFSFLPRQPVHSLLSGRHSSRLRGRGLAFEELRHYSQGDDVRTIQ